MTAYATLTALKARMNITTTDRDTALQTALDAASRMVDRYTGRRPNGFTLSSTATARIYDPNDRVVLWSIWAKLLVDEIGDATGLLVEAGSGTSWSTVTVNRTDPDSAIADGLPITGVIASGQWYGFNPLNLVRVTAKWGWPAVPDQVVMATLIQAQRFYNRKDSPEGVAGSADWGAIRVTRADPDVQALLAPFMLPGIG